MMPLGSMTKTERTVNGMLWGSLDQLHRVPQPGGGTRLLPLAVEVGEVLLIQHIVPASHCLRSARCYSQKDKRRLQLGDLQDHKVTVSSRLPGPSLDSRRTWRVGSAIIGNCRLTFESSFMLRPPEVRLCERRRVARRMPGLTRQSSRRGT